MTHDELLKLIDTAVRESWNELYLRNQEIGDPSARAVQQVLSYQVLSYQNQEI